MALDLQSKDPNLVALLEAKKKIAELEAQVKELSAGAGPVAGETKVEEKIVEKEKIVEVEKIVKVVEEKIVEKEKIVEVEKIVAAKGHNLNTNSKPTLGYWNIRGLGAQIRYLLHFCGV